MINTIGWMLLVSFVIWELRIRILLAWYWVVGVFLWYEGKLLISVGQSLIKGDPDRVVGGSSVKEDLADLIQIHKEQAAEMRKFGWMKWCKEIHETRSM